MPIYEHQCGQCAHVYEALIRRPSDEAEEVCPTCGSQKKDKLFSVFGMAGMEKGNGGGHSCGSCSSHNCGSCSSG